MLVTMRPNPQSHSGQALRRGFRALLLVTSLTGLVAGGLARLLQHGQLATELWTASTALGAAAALWWIVRSIREHRLGGDIIALLALIGTLVVHEELAGAVIAVMLTSGRALESYAAGRADRELRSLLARAPSTARRRRGTSFETIPIDSVQPGDVLSIGRGDVVPVDGTVLSERAVLDESALTGEAFPVERAATESVRSGVVNAGEPFELLAKTTSEEGTYAGIVRLVREAETARAPFVRLADRYALWFLVGALVLAAIAWDVSGELSRAVAVLVVATPCPLILAVPVALVSGLSSLARVGVVVKGGAVLERLTRCRTLLFDKTGTLTSGRPTLSDVLTVGERGAAETLRLAASLDQLSSHPLASGIVQAAHERQLVLAPPLDVEEQLGRGITGRVDGHHVVVGTAELVGLRSHDQLSGEARRRAELVGALTVFVGVDHEPAGVLIMTDPIRPDAARAIRAVRQQGIERTLMVTGDRSEVANAVGLAIGVDEVLAERSPAEKVDAVRAERNRAPVIMVGDGINDAPALALADVGVAMGVRGASASAEAADVVITVDRLDRIADACFIAHRTVRIALESITAGIAMSAIAMGFAAVGALPAVWGAMLQEVIDVAVILNALRALSPVCASPRWTLQDTEMFERARHEHVRVRAALDALSLAARACDVEGKPLDLARVTMAQQLLVEEVLPHEAREEEQLYPMLARMLGGTDRTSTMSRAHVEITHRIYQLGRLLEYIDPEMPDPRDVAELRRLLYGLHAILELHTTQEDESYLSWSDGVRSPEAVAPGAVSAKSQ